MNQPTIDEITETLDAACKMVTDAHGGYCLTTYEVLAERIRKHGIAPPKEVQEEIDDLKENLRYCREDWDRVTLALGLTVHSDPDELVARAKELHEATSSTDDYVVVLVGEEPTRRAETESGGIKVGDIVRVDFNASQCTLTKRAKVLSSPCVTGGGWVFKDTEIDTVYYVSEGCTITILEPAPKSGG